MSWDREIDELHHRSALAQRMGGEEKVARQHEFGKLTIRERIDAVADKDTFHEIGELAGRVKSGDTLLIYYFPD